MKSTRLVLFLTMFSACGGDDGAGALPDAPVGGDTVKVTMREGSAGIASDVVYQASGVETGTSMTTDANGVAVFSALADGMISVRDLHPESGEDRNWITVMGVQPGDDLAFRREAPRSRLDVRLVLPTITDPDLQSFEIATTCGSDGWEAGEASSVHLGDCATADVLVTAFDSKGPAQYLYQEDQVLSNTVDLTAQSFAPVATSPLAFTNLPPGVGSVETIRAPYTPRGQLGLCASDGTGPTVNVTCPAIPSAHFVDAAFLSQGTATWFAYDAAAATHDMTDALPRAITTAPQIDTTTRTVSWTESSTGATPDFIVLTLGGVVAMADGTTQQFSWEILLPYAPPPFTLPVLDADDGRFNIKPGESVYVTSFGLGTVSGGYALLRANLYDAATFVELVSSTSRVIATQYGGS